MPALMSFFALATASSKVAGQPGAIFLLTNSAMFSTAHGTP